MSVPETELAARAVAWLAAQGWDCYPEVQLRSGGDRADIVAVRDRIVHVVEVKTAFNLDVIAQADAWRFYAHYISVAVPNARVSRSRGFGEQVCVQRGIGVIYVGDRLPGVNQWERWRDGEPARLTRPRYAERLLGVLSTEHKRFAPGNANCQYYTPWRGTCDRLRALVHEQPGLTLRAAIDGLEHHYHTDATARSSLRHWISLGKIPGVRLDETTRPFTLHPEGA